MIRLVALMMLASTVGAAESAVDIDTAAKIYQAAAIREQVRASLGTMPAQMRKLFSRDVSAPLSEEQLAAVTAAAERGFRIDVFEAPALSALAAESRCRDRGKVEGVPRERSGRRMVAADVAAATLGEANIDKVMNGELAVPSTPKRDAIVDKLERATRSAESTVQVFLSMGQAVAVGTAIGSGLDPSAVAERARKSGEASRAETGGDDARAHAPISRLSYRDLSDSDLKHLLVLPRVVRRQALRDCVQRLDGRGLRRHGQAHRRAARRELARARAGAVSTRRRRTRPRRGLRCPDIAAAPRLTGEPRQSSARKSLQQRADRFDAILRAGGRS